VVLNTKAKQLHLKGQNNTYTIVGVPSDKIPLLAGVKPDVVLENLGGGAFNAHFISAVRNK